MVVIAHLNEKFHKRNNMQKREIRRCELLCIVVVRDAFVSEIYPDRKRLKE